MGRKARLKRDRRLGRHLEGVPETESARELRRRLHDLGVATAEGPVPGEVKISEAILAIAQPVIDRLAPSERTIPRLDSLLQVAQLAWNTHFLPDRSDLLDEAVRLLGRMSVSPELMREILGTMIERRRSLFPRDPRFVTHVVVRPGREPGQFDVSAACGMARRRSTT